MTVVLDARPPGVNLTYRAATTVTVTFNWPTGGLTGRSFTSTLDGEPLTVAVTDDALTVEISAAQASAAPAEALWLLLEDIDGTDEAVMVGTWRRSTNPAAASDHTVEITENAATVDVALATAPADARPLAGLGYGSTALARGEAVLVDPSATEILADLTGSGVVTSIWMAMAFNAAPGDMILRAFVDGEATPTVETDVGSLVAAHYTRGGTMDTDHVHIEGRETGGNLGWIFGFPMPFGDGIRIELHNPTASAQLIYWQVSYTRDTPPPYRLRSASATRLVPTVLAAVDTFEFFDISGAGWLVWNGVGLETATPGNGTWTERNVELFVDGEVTPTFVSTGWEDWFGGTFTFQGRQYVGSPFSMVGINTGDNLAVAVDLAKWYGGVRFDTGLRAVLDTEDGVTTGHSMGWVFLYYLHT